MRKATLALLTAAVSISASGIARAGDIQMVNPPPQQPVPATPAPQAVEPVPAAPVVAPPVKQKVVTENVDPPRNDMATIAVSAIMGGVAGLLVGGAIYYLDGRDHAERIGLWAAGGVLVGTGVGVIQVVAQESRASQAVSLWSPDPAPTYRLALYRVSF
jgi:hypothetical protein